jgi:surface protein
VKDMSFLFYGCELLKSLPDLSKWDLSNAVNIESIFTECKLLESLPDISNWNTKNVTNINQLFTDCLGANRMGMFSILTEPIELESDIISKLKRKQEQKYLAKMSEGERDVR